MVIHQDHCLILSSLEARAKRESRYCCSPCPGKTSIGRFSSAFYAPSLQLCPAEGLDFTPGKGELRDAKAGHLGLKELAQAWV